MNRNKSNSKREEYQQYNLKYLQQTGRTLPYGISRGGLDNFPIVSQCIPTFSMCESEYRCAQMNKTRVDLRFRIPNKDIPDIFDNV